MDTLRAAGLSVLLVLVVASPALPDGEDDAPGGLTDLDEVILGEQLVGPPVRYHDLEGQVVVLFQWGITCPISTGSFPYMNRLTEKYRDRGVVVVGFQVRRDPDVLAENVRWYLEHLRPVFPVCRLGNDWEWPAQYLPWVIVFDHTGKRIHAGNLPGLEEVLDEAVAALPAFDPNGETGKSFFARQSAKAEEELDSVVERAAVYRRLAERFDGTPLGAKAKARLEEIRSAPGFAAEEKAHAAFARVRDLLGRMPPAGQYAYNMDYSLIRDRSVRANRSRIMAEVHRAAGRIAREYPDARAASQARHLLLDLELPELSEAEAKARLELAKPLAAGTPPEVFDAWLLAYEVAWGYPADDEILGAADRLLESIEKDRAKELAAGEEEYRALSDAEYEIREAVRDGGSALPRAEADALLARLAATAEKAGSGSRLARRAAAFAESVVKSYDGPAQLGVRFDPRHEGEGAAIGWVYPKTAAENAGLRPGDVILAFAETEVKTGADLGQAIAAKKPGDEVRIRIRRANAEDADVTVVLGRRL